MTECSLRAKSLSMNFTCNASFNLHSPSRWMFNSSTLSTRRTRHPDTLPESVSQPRPCLATCHGPHCGTSRDLGFFILVMGILALFHSQGLCEDMYATKHIQGLQQLISLQRTLYWSFPSFGHFHTVCGSPERTLRESAVCLNCGSSQRGQIAQRPRWATPRAERLPSRNWGQRPAELFAIQHFSISGLLAVSTFPSL